MWIRTHNINYNGKKHTRNNHICIEMWQSPELGLMCVSGSGGHARAWLMPTTATKQRPSWWWWRRRHMHTAHTQFIQQQSFSLGHLHPLRWPVYCHISVALKMFIPNNSILFPLFFRELLFYGIFSLISVSLLFSIRSYDDHPHHICARCSFIHRTG